MASTKEENRKKKIEQLNSNEVPSGYQQDPSSPNQLIKSGNPPEIISKDTLKKNLQTPTENIISGGGDEALGISPEDILAQQQQEAQALLKQRDQSKELTTQEVSSQDYITPPSSTELFLEEAGRKSLSVLEPNAIAQFLAPTTTQGVSQTLEDPNVQKIAGGVSTLATAAGFIPLAVGSGFSLPVSLNSISTEVAKQSVKKSLTASIASATKNLAFITGGFFSIKSLVDIPENRIRDADSELSQIRETITAPVQGVQNGALTPSEALDLYDDMQQALDDAEITLKKYENQNYFRNFLGGSKSGVLRNRITKIQLFLDNARQTVAIAQVTGNVDPESIALLNQQLQSMQ